MNPETHNAIIDIINEHMIILKPVWFLSFQKTKSWLQLSPDKSRRGLYSGKIVFGFFRKPF